MKMKNRLPGVQTGVDGQAVSACVDIFHLGQSLGNQQHAPAQNGILVVEIVEGWDMPVGYDQDMGAGGGMGIPEGGYQVILVEHPLGRSTLDDFAKYAGRSLCFPTQQPHHQVMDGPVVIDKNAQVTWFPHL
jgi:hypothetical protein